MKAFVETEEQFLDRISERCRELDSGTTAKGSSTISYQSEEDFQANWFDDAMNQLDSDFENGYIDQHEYLKIRREIIHDYECEMKGE